MLAETSSSSVKPDRVINVVFAGLGGQGVLKASDILAEAAVRAGFDVKKSELHGMSQRGGSVTSDVRLGAQVLSPMVPLGEADYLVVLTADQFEPTRHYLRPGGVAILPDLIDPTRLPHRRSLNVALVGRLSHYLAIPETDWLAALGAHLPASVLELNQRAFALGRNLGAEPQEQSRARTHGL